MTAHLGHFEAPVSGFAVNGVPVVEATAAVLCPECLGDWCDACNHTGMALPSDWTAPAADPLPELAAAVERWLSTTCTTTPRKEAA